MAHRVGDAASSFWAVMGLAIHYFRLWAIVAAITVSPRCAPAPARHPPCHLAKLLGTGMNLLPMSSLTAGWLLSGASAQWKGARPGKVFEALIDGAYANPVIVVDEIDKANADAQYDPLGALYGLLEYD